MCARGQVRGQPKHCCALHARPGALPTRLPARGPARRPPGPGSAVNRPLAATGGSWGAGATRPALPPRPPPGARWWVPARCGPTLSEASRLREAVLGVQARPCPRLPPLSIRLSPGCPRSLTRRGAKPAGLRRAALPAQGGCEPGLSPPPCGPVPGGAGGVSLSTWRWRPRGRAPCYCLRVGSPDLLGPRTCCSRFPGPRRACRRGQQLGREEGALSARAGCEAEPPACAPGTPRPRAPRCWCFCLLLSFLFWRVRTWRSGRWGPPPFGSPHKGLNPAAGRGGGCSALYKWLQHRLISASFAKTKRPPPVPVGDFCDI